MIGLFDSGHGGLTILKALVERLPRQGFIYLGDHAFAPYGEKPPATILARSQAGVAALFELGCSLVILACNTAAAIALREMQQNWLPRHYPQGRCLGVLVPIVEAIAQAPWHVREAIADSERKPETIGIFATPATVASGAYAREIARRAPQIRVIERACPELVGLIEAGADDSALAGPVRRHVEALLDELRGAKLDAAVLGCTHYPLIEPLFRAALPAGTRLFSQPERVAQSLIAYLFRHPEAKRFGAQPAPLLAYTTGDHIRVSALASRFFGRHLAFAPLPPSLAPEEIRPEEIHHA